MVNALMVSKIICVSGMYVCMYVSIICVQMLWTICCCFLFLFIIFKYTLINVCFQIGKQKLCPNKRVANPVRFHTQNLPHPPPPPPPPPPPSLSISLYLNCRTFRWRDFDVVVFDVLAPCLSHNFLPKGHTAWLMIYLAVCTAILIGMWQLNQNHVLLS